MARFLGALQSLAIPRPALSSPKLISPPRRFLIGERFCREVRAFFDFPVTSRADEQSQVPQPQFPVAIEARSARDMIAEEEKFQSVPEADAQIPRLLGERSATDLRSSEPRQA